MTRKKITVVFLIAGSWTVIVFFAGWFIRSTKAPSPPVPAPVMLSSPTAWELRSQHFIYGLPRPRDSRYVFCPPGMSQASPGLSVLIRPGFVVVHSDRWKIPVAVCAKWTRECFKLIEHAQSPPRHFHPDPELPEYARGEAEYGKDSGFDRGHMSRNLDNAAWGEHNADAGDLMSNIVPQTQSLNGRAWLALEEAHHRIVARGKIKEIWIIAGAILKEAKPERTIANGVGVPWGTYKVIAWFDQERRLNARAYVYAQDADDKEPLRHLTSVQDVEEQTGLNFFPELDEAGVSEVELIRPKKMWE